MTWTGKTRTRTWTGRTTRSACAVARTAWVALLLPLFLFGAPTQPSAQVCADPALMQFDDLWRVGWVLGVFGIGQFIEGNLVTPKFVGERIGLHPLAVIFALLAFGQLFGFAGLLVALPASAVLLVGLRKLREQYRASELYGSR